jgi:hypothetical protein
VLLRHKLGVPDPRANDVQGEALGKLRLARASALLKELRLRFQARTMDNSASDIAVSLPVKMEIGT